MYCLPLAMYVIGALLTPAGNSISHAIAPVFLSNARNFLPPHGPPGGRPTPLSLPSPMNTKLLVTSAASRPGVPSGGRLSPLNAGWLRSPSPLATEKAISPLFRSIPTSREYGGLNGSGSPCGPSGHGTCCFTYGNVDSGCCDLPNAITVGM